MRRPHGQPCYGTVCKSAHPRATDCAFSLPAPDRGPSGHNGTGPYGKRRTMNEAKLQDFMGKLVVDMAARPSWPT